MIILEKYEGENKLEAWSRTFNGVNELIRFMKINKCSILGQGYKLVIKEYPNLKTSEHLFKKEGKIKWLMK